MTWRPGGDLKDDWGGGEFERRGAGAVCICRWHAVQAHTHTKKNTHPVSLDCLQMLNKLAVQTSKWRGVCACKHLQHYWVTNHVLPHTHRPTARQTARPGKSQYPELHNSNMQSLPLRTRWRMWEVSAKLCKLGNVIPLGFRFPSLDKH